MVDKETLVEDAAVGGSDLDELRALRAEMATMRTQIAEQAKAIAALGSAAAPELATVGPVPTDAAVDEPALATGPVSRRKMLLGSAGAAAVGAAALISASASPAAANGQGQSLTLGDPSNTASNTTGITGNFSTLDTLRVTNTAAALPTPTSGRATLRAILGDPSGLSGYGASLVGESQVETGVAGRSMFFTGVYGTSVGASGFTATAGVIGESSTKYGTAGFSTSSAGVRAASSTAEGIRATSTSSVGGSFAGGRAAINLAPRSTTGKPTTGAHSRGDIVVDSVGAMFLCTKSGTPGTWVKVSVTQA